MKRLGYAALDNKICEDMYNAIQNQYASKQRLMIVFPRNDTESIIYMPYKNEYELLIPNIDPIHNIYAYKTVKFTYEEGILDFIDKINNTYEKLTK